MFSAKIILLSGTLPLGAWQTWTVLDQSHLVIRVAFAVMASFGIFMAILAATEYATVVRRARAAVPREPAIFARARLHRRAAAAA
jgi:hypothetical protein